MPLLKLKQISSIDNYYKFTFEPISVHFGTCSLINMTRYIYRFLSDMGTRNCISEVKNFIPFRLDGIQIIINLSFINCDKAISQNNIKNCEIVMRKMYYTFKTNHYITFNYLILMAIKKQAKIVMDGSELIYPEELIILIPKGKDNLRVCINYRLLNKAIAIDYYLFLLFNNIVSIVFKAKSIRLFLIKLIIFINFFYIRVLK